MPTWNRLGIIISDTLTDRKPTPTKGKKIYNGYYDQAEFILTDGGIWPDG
jgi:hypothetical protein